MSRIELRAIRKIYPPDVVAVDGIDLSVDDGEVLSLVGPTGSRKSTILRLIAPGWSHPPAARSGLDGHPVDTEPRERGMAMVFQDHAVVPHPDRR